MIPGDLLAFLVLVVPMILFYSAVGVHAYRKRRRELRIAEQSRPTPSLRDVHLQRMEDWDSRYFRALEDARSSSHDLDDRHHAF